VDELWVAQLGVTPYAQALALQERLRLLRQEGAVPDVLLVLEHPPVYTRGRRTQAGDLPRGEAWYRERGIAVVDSDRGGRVTYHGPGQLVAYPIMAIDSVPGYVRTLEETVVAALADEGIAAEPREGPFTGVWTGDAKIASIGVHVSRGVTTHGLAVNVDNDLQPFEWILPCGMGEARVTSVARETGRARSLPCFRRRLAHRLAGAFDRRQRLVTGRRLREAGRVAEPAAA
jgi:lipoyl(octanoyl) transferase